MRMRKNTALSLVLALSLLFPSISCAWSGEVVGVADGDTITVLHSKTLKLVAIRLYGIDCPEKGQAFNKRARQFTSVMAHGKIVQVNPITKDEYGRTVAIVAVGKSLLNEEVIKAGFGWVYSFDCHERICESWKAKQLKAKIAKQGLWQNPDPLPPWQFKRKMKK